MSTTTTIVNSGHDDGYASTATTPGLDIPGAFPKAHANTNGSGVTSANTTGTVESVRNTAEQVLTAAGQTAKDYLPKSVVERLKGVGFFAPQEASPDSTTTSTTDKPSLPSQESESTFQPTHTGGVGSLPGHRDESAVAQLPHEREAANTMSTEADTTTLNRAEAKKPAAVVVNDPAYDKDPHATANATLVAPSVPHPSSHPNATSAIPLNPTNHITSAAAAIPVPETPSTTDNASIVPIPPASKVPSTSTSYTSNSVGTEREKDRPFREPAQERTHAFGSLDVNMKPKEETKPLPATPDLTPEEKAAREREREREKERRRREPAQEKTHAFSSASSLGASPPRSHASEVSEGDGHTKGHGRKPSFGQKFKGEMKVIAGKLTGDAKKVERGKAMMHADA